MDNLSERLAAWDAASARRRARSLRQQVVESTTLAGLFVDLAERGLDVSVVLVGGGVRNGVVQSVGADFVAVGSTLIPFRAVAGVRGAAASSGDRAVEGALRFTGVLARLAEERADVAAALDGGETVSGPLRAAADGVVLVGDTWVAVAAVVALLVV